MKTYFVPVPVLLKGHHCPEAEIADALHGNLTEDMRNYTGDRPDRLGRRGRGHRRVDHIRSSPGRQHLPGPATEDDSIIASSQEHMPLARMEAAEGHTRRHLRIIERQILPRGAHDGRRSREAATA